MIISNIRHFEAATWPKLKASRSNVVNRSQNYYQYCTEHIKSGKVHLKLAEHAQAQPRAGRP